MLEDHDVPVVLYSRLPGRRQVSYVSCDHAACDRILAAHLLEVGHRDFALVHGPAASSVAVERMAGVADELRAAGLDGFAAARGDYSYGSGVEAARQLAAARDLNGVALIAANDMMALGALDHLRFALGVKVPAQAVVAGFDGIGAARWRSYDLTTVGQPLQRMAQAAAAMIAERVNAEPVGERRIFPGELILRHSSD